MPLSKEGLLERWGESEAPPKNVILLLWVCLASKWLQLGSNMILIITSTGNDLLRGFNIDDLE